MRTDEVTQAGGTGNDMVSSTMDIDLSGAQDNMETPWFTRRAIVSLATDPNPLVRAGKRYIVADLAPAYGFTDVDGNLTPVIADVETLETVAGMAVAWAGLGRLGEH